ncbi:GIY-YIG nuclease family protein [Carboxylicivirga sediminis]|uniref:GIY-YIG nuclease family protein n=1 Tax=Carboxylicivirga sediminis TaxID=2006564 RepID=A0A941F4F2_9BACT|nr:GIY-YIG nuclease family protein [Carboxylicivirga sediminis]
MFYVYVIKSQVQDWIYVGLSDNVERRIHEHNSGWGRSTKLYRQFKLLFVENYPDRPSARIREKYLKSASGKRFIRKKFNQ